MRKLLSLLLGKAAICAVYCAIAAPAVAQQDFSKVEIKTTKLADSVYMMTGSGGNLAVSAGADGVILIDDQFAPLSEKIQVAIAAISDQPVK